MHPVPGASALLAALVTAGLPTDRFWFEGFLPAKAGQRGVRLKALAGLDVTSVVYESPRRIAATLRELTPLVAPTREAVVAREITKRFEEIRRGTVAELADIYADEATPKGEIVFMLAPVGDGAVDAPGVEDLDVRLAGLVAEMGMKEAASRLAAETGLKRRDLYQRALKLAEGPG